MDMPLSILGSSTEGGCRCLHEPGPTAARLTNPDMVSQVLPPTEAYFKAESQNTGSLEEAAATALQKGIAVGSSTSH